MVYNFMECSWEQNLYIRNFIMGHNYAQMAVAWDVGFAHGEVQLPSHDVLVADGQEPAENVFVEGVLVEDLVGLVEVPDNREH